MIYAQVLKRVAIAPSTSRPSALRRHTVAIRQTTPYPELDELGERNDHVNIQHTSKDLPSPSISVLGISASSCKHGR